MKKWILFLALAAFSFGAKAQTWHVVIDPATNGNGTVSSRYYIDSSKILHWEMWAESPDPYIADIYTQDGWENMVQFNVYLPDSQAGINEYYLDEETFPYGFTGQYGGTIDLSAYTWTEITQMDCQSSFDRISSGTPQSPNYTDIIELVTLQQ